MAFAALGIVFGDIGTSPMYALQASIQSPGLPPGAVSIFGVASLIFWTLNLIVSVKYLMFITHVHNEGEGGVFALTSALRDKLTSPVGQAAIVGLVMLSAGLLFADSLITPPLSILAAIEGVQMIDAETGNFVMIASIGVLVLLFGAQRFGTQALSVFFSPIMALWFTVIGGLGLVQVVGHPEVLWAISPVYALEALKLLTWPQIFGLFGSILLAATGAEAIYADMGHFGRKPIGFAWYFFAVGALILSYFGQSAWLLENVQQQTGNANPFFSIVPKAFLIPMVILATLASIIAGQAVISGMFSIVNQAIRQGYLPRLRIVQTSETVRGQIYIPLVSRLLALGGVLLALGFGSSAALASCYGFAVSATMLLTTLAFTLVVVLVWKWSFWKVLAFSFFALPLDMLFLASTMTKLPSGHYMTLIITIAVAWAMLSWYLGNRYLSRRAQRIDIPVDDFAEVATLRKDLIRQQRPALFFQHLAFQPDGRVTPLALLQQVQVTSMLYQPAVIVEFITTNHPRVAEQKRITLLEYPNNIKVVHAYFGYWEPLSIDPVVRFGRSKGWWNKEDELVYYAAGENLRLVKSGGLPWSLKLPYALLHRADQHILRSVKLDPSRCVELGSTVEI